MSSELYQRIRYRFFPDHVVGEVLAKAWIDTAIPFLFLLLSLALFGALVPNFFNAGDFGDMSRLYGEYLLVAIGMTIVVLAGGIDLSVGSNFALANFMTLLLMNYLHWPLYLTVPVVIGVSAAIGLVNGILIGYLRLRAFLTTLVTLIVVRAFVDRLLLDNAVAVGSGIPESEAWDFLSFGSIIGLSPSLVAAVIIAIAVHILLSRARIGWHIIAVGGSRRSAHNVGIKVRRTVCLTYVMSGALCGLAGLFFAARLGSLGADTGAGLEVTILTAVVLGGTSLGGGRGSVTKTALGAVIVLIISNSLIRLGLPSGADTLVLGLVLLAAVAFDVRWLKNKHKVLSKAYVSPTYLRLVDAPETAAESGTPYAVNDKLHGVESIGLGELDGPEDMILDEDDNLYCGSRHGDIIRFEGPHYKKWEVYAHVGGHPLGLAMDADQNILTCVAGMGVYKVTRDREIIKLSDETNRSLLSVIDDSRLKLADDLDIAPDGKIYFSEATIRYEMFDWIVDGLEARGNGRIICYDPKTGSSRTVLANLLFPNGICMVGDGESLLFAQTWACSISRYYFAGPKAGQIEPVIANLPGYPDNINVASDGTFWCALCGMRSPAFDLALRKPSFRRQMVQRVARDEWIYPNMNTGCVIKFDLNGNVLDVLWDRGGEAHPQITSIREHKGYLYLGGVHNNRIGRYKIPGADPEWTSQKAYWGKGK